MESYCIDLSHIHISGYSNGGTFTYRMFSYSELELGAFGAVSGAPFISAGDVPKTPRSLIDFHGLDDWTVPRQYDHSPGEGPVGQARTTLRLLCAVVIMDTLIHLASLRLGWRRHEFSGPSSRTIRQPSMTKFLAFDL